LRAQVQLTPTEAYDVYCGNVTTGQSQVPYSGAYGATNTGWYDENALQIAKLVAEIPTRSGAAKAIVMGNFNTSEAYSDPNSGKPLVAALNPDLLATLRQTFAEAVPTTNGFLPQCNYCPTNPYNTDITDAGTWTDRIFLLNIPASKVVGASYGFQDAVVPLAGADGGAAMAPLSNAWSYRAVISR